MCDHQLLRPDLVPRGGVGPLHESCLPLGVEDLCQNLGWVYTDVRQLGRQRHTGDIGEDDLFIGLPGVECNVALSERHLVHRTRGDDVLAAHEARKRHRLKRRTSKVFVRAGGGGDYTHGSNLTRVDGRGEEQGIARRGKGEPETAARVGSRNQTLHQQCQYKAGLRGQEQGLT